MRAIGRFKGIIFIFALALTTGYQSFSQPQTYTIDEAVLAALDNNVDTRIAIMDIEKAQAAVNEAFGYALPSIDLNANISHLLLKPKTPFPDLAPLLAEATGRFLENTNVATVGGDAFKWSDAMIPPSSGTTLMEMALANNYEANAQLTQVLFSSAVFRGIGATKIYLETSKEMLRGKAVTTILNVKKAFYGVLLTKELLNILEASLNNAKENLDNLRALQKHGLVSEFDLLQAEVQVENINPNVLELKNALETTKNSLKIVMGIDQSADIDVVGDLSLPVEDIPDEKESINQAMSSNYDIKTLTLKQQVDEAMIELDRAEYWPTIAAFATYSRAGTADDLHFQHYGTSAIGLSFTMNLFQGDRTKNKVEQSTITSLQTEQQLFQLKDYVTTEVKAKLLELDRVKSILEAQERNVKLAERAYGLAKVRYKEGTGTQLEIKNADMDLRTARTNKLNSVYNYIVAKAELESLMGDISAKYLKAINAKIPTEK